MSENSEVKALMDYVILSLKSGKNVESHDKERSTCVRFESGKFIYEVDDRLGHCNTENIGDEHKVCAFLEKNYAYSAQDPNDRLSVWKDLKARIG